MMTDESVLLIDELFLLEEVDNSKESVNILFHKVYSLIKKAQYAVEKFRSSFQF